MGAKRSATRLIDLETVRFTGSSESILRISVVGFTAWEDVSHGFRGAQGIVMQMLTAGTSNATAWNEERASFAFRIAL